MIYLKYRQLLDIKSLNKSLITTFNRHSCSILIIEKYFYIGVYYEF